MQEQRQTSTRAPCAYQTSVTICATERLQDGSGVTMQVRHWLDLDSTLAGWKLTQLVVKQMRRNRTGKFAFYTLGEFHR